MAWPVVERAFSPTAFKAYVDGLEWTNWRPQFACLHNTAAPSLAQRPGGLTNQHIKNLERYYRDERGWNGGPHLFIDDRQIWVFNDLTKMGVHSPSWNRVALGIEMLGDFDTESFCDGRGAKVRANTVAAMAALNRKLGFAAGDFRFHIEDKKSNHACPGKLARAERDALVDEIGAAMAAYDAPEAHVTISSTKHEHAHPADERERWVIPAADGEKPEKRGYFDDWSFAKVNELAEQGSRTAQHLRGAKNWLLWRIFGITTGGGITVATLADTNKGTVHVVASDPFLLGFLLGLAVGVAVVSLLAYCLIKFRIEPGFVAAARDQRYRPRGA